jgi:PAS domain S-box-containing protein
MFARFIMDTDFLAGSPTDSVMLAQWWSNVRPHRTVYVVNSDRHYVGRLRLSSDLRGKASGTLADYMEPASATVTVDPDTDADSLRDVFAAHPDWPSIPVVAPDRTLLGVITRDTLRPFVGQGAPRFTDAASEEWLQQRLLEAFNSGLIVLDAHGIVRFINRFGADLLGVRAERVTGRPYEEIAQYVFPHMQDYLRHSAVPEIFSLHTGYGEKEFVIQNGRHVRFSFGTIQDGDSIVAAAITFIDVTNLREAEAQAETRAREAEMAFGLALPNSKVESKLRASPEYQDRYDQKTGRATVTQVIEQGTYWHVVNGLRIMAELKALGLFQLVGLDKDTLVQAFIFHDLGKEQPRLRIGQEFVPHETFEPGYIHAARSAEWAVKEYNVGTDVAWLIRYHHTAEADLPETFPDALKPMWRLLKIVDGLSAGITRRNATIAPLTRDGTTLTIRENNADHRYHRAYTVSVYTGDERPLP